MGRVLACCMVATVVSVMAQSAAVSDRDWKKWLEDVKPLMAAAERAEVPKVPAEAREEFREAFWARRNPGGQPQNAQRAEFEQRVADADKRFRGGSSGPWNDCGRVFVVLGKPDLVTNRTNSAHFDESDRLKAFREQDDAEAEQWLYRNPPRLPPAAQGYVLRFTMKCETLNGPGFERMLNAAAATYLR